MSRAKSSIAWLRRIWSAFAGRGCWQFSRRRGCYTSWKGRLRRRSCRILEPGEASVGYGFEFQHLAPTPAGDTVVATATVTAVEGKMVHLDFEARDSRALVARGNHVRAIIHVERFSERLKNRGDPA